MNNYAFFSSGKSGLQSELSQDISPAETFQLFVTDDILSHIVIETNRYAAQLIASNKLSKKKSKKHRLSQWVDTTLAEIKLFFGLLLWMGLVRHGSIQEYWSTSPLLQNQVASKVMARNRFQLLLSCIHFVNNNTVDNTDRLHKIRPIVDQLQTNFQLHYSPGNIFLSSIHRMYFVLTFT